MPRPKKTKWISGPWNPKIHLSRRKKGKASQRKKSPVYLNRDLKELKPGTTSVEDVYKLIQGQDHRLVKKKIGRAFTHIPKKGGITIGPEKRKNRGRRKTDK